VHTHFPMNHRKMAKFEGGRVLIMHAANATVLI
jgi:hypothetical protein